MSRSQLREKVCRFWRKISRRRRFTRLRATARLSIFVVTAMASLLSSPEFSCASMRKCLLYILVPLSLQRAMSLFLRRRPEGRNERSRLSIVTLAWSCDSKLLSALCAPSVQDLATTLSSHSLAESVCGLATLLTWLIRAFHSVLPVLMSGEV